jgi:hypothetical protein
MIKNRGVLAQLDSAILQAVARASKRSFAIAHQDMSDGVSSLATIACIAPWIGMFGTLLGIVNSFRGITGSRSSGMAALAKALSESMWPTAFGLAVGIVALWCYRYLEGRLQTLDHEMENASIELLNQLSRFRRRFSAEPSTILPSDGPMFGEKPLAEFSPDEKFLLPSILLAGTALAGAWCVQMARYFGQDAIPLHPALWAACVYLVLMCGLSFVPAYPVWTLLLRRRSGALVALASIICLCWSIAELVLDVPIP